MTDTRAQRETDIAGDVMLTHTNGQRRRRPPVSTQHLRCFIVTQSPAAQSGSCSPRTRARRV